MFLLKKKYFVPKNGRFTETVLCQLCKRKEIIVDICPKAHAFEGKSHKYFIKLVKRDISAIL